MQDRSLLDDLDRGLVHALHLDGRAAFRDIAEVLGVSTQTVTRRYQRLRREAGLRIVALPAIEAPGISRWLVRITAAPSTASGLARSLARRRDTSWVRLTSGGTEIVAVVAAATGDAAAPALLLHDMPRTSSVTAVNAHALLHFYLGGPTTWPGREIGLSAGQQARLRRVTTAPDAVPRDPARFDDGERRLLDVLAVDGRTGYTELAAATGWSPATVARRLAALRDAGEIYLDIELDDTRLGVRTQAILWLSVAPARLDGTARALAAHADLAFVAATTGPHNLVAQVLVSDPGALHRYLTGPLAALGTVQSLDVTPVLHTVKAAGPLRDG